MTDYTDRTEYVKSFPIKIICCYCGVEITPNTFFGTETYENGILCKDCAIINFLKRG